MKGWHRLVLIVLAVVAAVVIMTMNTPSLDISTCQVGDRPCTVQELHARYEAGNQRGLLLGVIPIGVVLLIILSDGLLLLVRSQRAAVSRDAEALLDALIPPEVRAVRPDVRAADARPRGVAGMMAVMMVGAVALPFIAVIGQEVLGLDAGSGVLDDIITGVVVIGAAASLVLVRRARRAGTTRADVLGLAIDHAPIPIPGLGLERAHTVMHGRRYGRDVLVAQHAGGHTIQVHAALPGPLDARADGGRWGGQAPPAAQVVLGAAAVEPGTAALTADGTAVVLHREVGVAALGEQGDLVLLRDLQLVEAIADAAGAAVAPLP